jgi:hypothetical protein
MPDLDLLKAALLILEGKKPEKKDKKDDDIEIDVKTKDGKVTKLHTKDGDGDGKVLDGSKAEQKVPSKDKKKDDSKSDDGDSDKASSKKSDDSDESGNDSKPKKKSDSPVKDDSNDDGAEEKEVPDDSSDDDSKSDDEDSDDSKDSDDELDKSKDGDGSDQKSDSEKEDEVDGSEKTKINLKPKIKDEEPGEMPVSEEQKKLVENIERAKTAYFTGDVSSLTGRAIVQANERRALQLEHDLAISVFNSNEWIVEHDELGIGQILEAKTSDTSFIAELTVMFEDTVALVQYDLQEISAKVLDEKHIGFKKLEKKLSHEKGVYNPAGLAAAIGRKKYGAKKFKQMSEEIDVNEASVKKIDRYLDKADLDYAHRLYTNPSDEDLPAWKRKQKNRTKGMNLAIDKLGGGHRPRVFAKEDVSEAFAQAGTNALQIAKHHESMQAHHEEMTAHHENDENYGLAKKHDMAAHLHGRAADSYREAARAFRLGADDRGDYHLDNAERHANSADQHEAEHNIRPSAS